MHKFDSWLVSVLGVLGFGVSHTLLVIPGLFGFIVSMFWASMSAGIGYITRLVIDVLLKKIKAFISLHRTKKNDK